MESEVGRRLVVIVPVHNEVACITEVIREIRGCHPDVHVVVIDDGSSDGSAQAARAAHATVISLPYNLGIGGAVQTGYLYACDFESCIIARLDGDGQHDPTQLLDLIRPLEAGEADVVIGSRYLLNGGYRASWTRWLGIKVFATLVSLITRKHLTDTTSGFQAVSCSAGQFLARHMPTDYPEIEGTVLLSRAGFRIQEVPITMRARLAGRSSITPFRAVYYVLKVSLSLLVGLIQPPPHRERG
jgi:glycosyltransferase involved in cell wall biosynthesis